MRMLPLSSLFAMGNRADGLLDGVEHCDGWVVDFGVSHFGNARLSTDVLVGIGWTRRVDDILMCGFSALVA